MTTEHDRTGIAGPGASIAAIVAIALLPGCSTQPSKTADTTGAAATSATASRSGTETTVTHGPTAPSAKIPSGYRRLTRHGKELFCREVVTLGSRFPEQMCFTREQLEDIATRTGETMNNMERSKAVCTGGSQCAGT